MTGPCRRLVPVLTAELVITLVPDPTEIVVMGSLIRTRRLPPAWPPAQHAVTVVPCGDIGPWAGHTTCTHPEGPR